jgi:hypothetical protein
MEFVRRMQRATVVVPTVNGKVKIAVNVNVLLPFLIRFVPVTAIAMIKLVPVLAMQKAVTQEMIVAKLHVSEQRIRIKYQDVSWIDGLFRINSRRSKQDHCKYSPPYYQHLRK